ncbi:MAG: IS30 family transposase [Clostridia bacterium]|nr:IS30 family transposase [Clostridia bacterium]
MSRLTLSDRVAIESGIYEKLKLNEIAKKISKSPGTVSREIKLNSTKVAGEKPYGKDCVFAGLCRRCNLCGRIYCSRKCVTCREFDCRTVCKRYCNEPCTILSKPPYVCNTCSNRRRCKADRAYYISHQADAMSKRRYSEARSNIQADIEELAKIDEIVSPLILKGQPLTHIWSEHGEEIGISQRTLYRYIDLGVLSVGNIDLRRKVAYRPRKKKKEVSEWVLNQNYRKNRGYDDYLKYMEKHPNTSVVQMDTVKGIREQGKRMLTLHFCDTNMMLILLMLDCKADSVVEQFDRLTGLLGLEEFRKVFPVILTDNGSEFKYTRELEMTEDGKRRTKVFYCDPQASWQKPKIEKNHEFIRYVLPKGKSFSPYTQDDMVLLMNHINSVKRDILKGISPYEAVKNESVLHLMELMGLKLIPADEVNLTPSLLKK